jgi:hypothetical protein
VIGHRKGQVYQPRGACINDALRAGLSNTGKEERTTRFVVKPWPLGLKAGIYEGKLGQLLNQLETEEFNRKMSQ